MDTVCEVEFKFKGEKFRTLFASKELAFNTIRNARALLEAAGSKEKLNYKCNTLEVYESTEEIVKAMRDTFPKFKTE